MKHPASCPCLFCKVPKFLNIMKDLVFLTPIVLVIIIGVIIVAICNYRLRKRVLEAGPLDDYALKFLATLSTGSSELLKWAIILFFGGLGLIVLEFLPYGLNDSPLPYGVQAVCLAAGCLVYFLISKKNKAQY